MSRGRRTAPARAKARPRRVHITPTSIDAWEVVEGSLKLSEWRGGRRVEVVIHLGSQGSWLPMRIARWAKKHVQEARDSAARILARETANVRELGGDA